MKQHFSTYIVASFILLLGASNISANDTNTASGVDQTFLFFPFAHVEIRQNVAKNQNLEQFETGYGSDFFYLLNYKNYRAVAEFALTSHEFELERLKLGIDLTTDDTLWLGRFHSPLDYWSSSYHHGLHLQTSVHRPSIIEYEDSGGILPSHITGLLFNGQKETGYGIIKYSTALGYAPTLKQSLTPYNLGQSKNKLHAILKIGYQADETDPSESGFVISQSTLGSETDSFKQIKQRLLGVYSHKSFINSRVTASAFFINNVINRLPAEETSSSFIASYIHGEYDLASKLITYLRFERAFKSENDPYLDFFDHYETQRNLAGIRYDITRRQAISSEVSKRVNAHDSHTHISIQWSAVFP